MPTVAFSQRDRRWAQQKLGNGSLTMSQAGCAVTASASMLASWGVSTNPGDLNNYLRDHGGYVDDNLLVWSALEAFGAKLERYISCITTPAPISELETYIASGYGIIALVNATPGSKLSAHWIRLLTLADRSACIVDPWQLPGYEYTGIEKYLAKSWDTKRGIFAAAVYSYTGIARRDECTGEHAISGTRNTV